MKYLHGFRNHHCSEALPNTLPVGQNTPQKVAHGLYAEQLSGSAFTSPRAQNLHSWLYRIRPSVVQGIAKPYSRHALFTSADFQSAQPPSPMRWSPLDELPEQTDFISGLIPVAISGSLQDPAVATYLYQIKKTQADTFYTNNDAEWLWIPQTGELQLETEFGILKIKAGDIAVIPRGVQFKLKLLSESTRGYLCENYKTPLMLPELGPIGANGLANARDFYIPTAHYEDLSGSFNLITKYQQHLWTTELTHSPLDVVAWHGNYTPYQYDLNHFNTLGSISFDHPDPSIFTVLTSPSEILGTANLDFVIFPERWMVAEHTFRPPYFHRNIMSELMGLIYGVYDAKETGFEPGGISLHNCMVPHGPDAQAFEKASEQTLKPQYYQGTLAFMLETRQVWHVTHHMLNHPKRQHDYPTCWNKIKKQFSVEKHA
jgi:homogentisate 1,2-dioxygenase